MMNTRSVGLFYLFILLIIMAVIGGFAVSTANANYKLSKQAHDWTRSYYALDEKAELFLASVDGRLVLAWQQTNELLTGTETEEQIQMIYTNAVLDTLSDFFVEETPDSSDICAIVKTTFYVNNNYYLHVSLGVEYFQSIDRYKILAWQQINHT